MRNSSCPVFGTTLHANLQLTQALANYITASMVYRSCIYTVGFDALSLLYLPPPISTICLTFLSSFVAPLSMALSPKRCVKVSRLLLTQHTLATLRLLQRNLAHCGNLRCCLCSRSFRNSSKPIDGEGKWNIEHNVDPQYSKVPPSFTVPRTDLVQKDVCFTVRAEAAILYRIRIA